MMSSVARKRPLAALAALFGVFAVVLASAANPLTAWAETGSASSSQGANLSVFAVDGTVAYSATESDELGGGDYSVAAASAAEYEAASGPGAWDAIKRVLYVGYPTDAAGYGADVSVEAFREATQEAVLSLTADRSPAYQGELAATLLADTTEVPDSVVLKYWTAAEGPGLFTLEASKPAPSEPDGQQSPDTTNPDATTPDTNGSGTNPEGNSSPGPDNSNVTPAGGNSAGTPSGNAPAPTNNKTLKRTLGTTADPGPTATVSVVKEWVDDATPVPVQVQLLRDGEVVDDTVVLDAEGDWFHAWMGLPVNDSQGRAYNYNVAEVVPEGYMLAEFSSISNVDVDGNVSIAYNFTNDQLPTTTVDVYKRWAAGTEKVPVTFQLMCNGEPQGDPVEVTQGMGWTYEWEGLPQTDDTGHAMSYNVAEIVPAGYAIVEHSVASRIDYRGNVTFGHSFVNGPAGDGPTETMTVEKHWTEGSEPVPVDVVLMRDGEPYGDPLNLSEANEWVSSWTGLPVTDETGERYSYTVAEVVPDGYEVVDWSVISNVDPAGNVSAKYVFTNGKLPTTSVRVDKEWSEGSRPEPIQVQLLRNNEPLGAPAEVNADSQWSHLWTDLPQADAAGEEYTYSVEEIVPEGYEQVSSSKISNIDAKGNVSIVWTFVNRQLDPTPTVRVTAHKKWAEGAVPGPVSVFLLRDDEAPFGSVSLNDGNNWQYTWKDLPKTDPEDSHEYEYTVMELIDAGYEQVSESSDSKTDALGNVDIDYTFVNDGEPIDPATRKAFVSVAKDFVEGVEPFPVRIQLLRNGEPVGEPVELSDANDWHHNWEPQPKVDDKGAEYTYSVNEIVPPGYEQISARGTVGYDLEGNIYITYGLTNDKVPTATVVAEKTWEEGSQAVPIQVQLWRDGVAQGDPVELNEEGDWTYAWEDLPIVGEDSHTYEYVAKEIVPEGYQQTAWSVMSNIDDRGNVATKCSFTNAELPTLTLVAEKEWDGGAQPVPINVQMMRNGESQGDPVELNEANGWTYTWDELPLADAEGAEYDYTLAEIVPQGYMQIRGDATDSIDDFGNVTRVYTFVNREAPVLPTTVTVTAEKKWMNPEDAVDVEVALLRNGEEIGTRFLTAESEWKTMWQGLPKVDGEGAALTYDVEEVVPEGYTQVLKSLGTDRASNVNVSFTNAKNVKVDFSKVDAATGEALEGAELRLVHKSEKSDEAEVVETWTSAAQPHSVELPPGDYALEEVAAPDGYLVAEPIAFTVDAESRHVLVNGEPVDDALIVMKDEKAAQPDPVDPPSGDPTADPDQVPTPDETTPAPTASASPSGAVYPGSRSGGTSYYGGSAATRTTGKLSKTGTAAGMGLIGAMTMLGAGAGVLLARRYRREGLQ